MFNDNSKNHKLYYTAGIVSIINSFFLVYVGWQKHNSTGCSACHIVPFLPVTDIAVAAIGFIASLILAFLCYYAKYKKVIKFLALFTALTCAGFASFLVSAQLLHPNSICYQCLVVALGFYLIFIILFVEVIIRSLWLRLTGTENP